MTPPAVHLELHNLYGLVKGAQGRADVWAGHRAVAFGLEPTLDTHTTMLQSFAMDSIGFKADWGAGVDGRFAKWDYRAAATLGAGMPAAFHGNWLGAARLGVLQPERDDVGFGFSALYGQTLPTMELTLVSTTPGRRAMAGADATWQRGRVTVAAEGVYGATGDDLTTHVASGWLRATVNVPAWRWFTAAAQGSVFYDDLGMRREMPPMASAGLELTAKYNAAITPGLAYFFSRETGRNDHKVFVHFYYVYPNLGKWRPS